MLTENHGVAQSLVDLYVDPWLIGAAIAMGLVTSPAAAQLRPRSPVGASIRRNHMTKRGFHTLGEGENRCAAPAGDRVGALRAVVFAFSGWDC